MKLGSLFSFRFSNHEEQQSSLGLHQAVSMIHEIVGTQTTQVPATFKDDLCFTPVAFAAKQIATNRSAGCRPSRLRISTNTDNQSRSASRSFSRFCKAVTTPLDWSAILTVSFASLRWS